MKKILFTVLLTTLCMASGHAAGDKKQGKKSKGKIPAAAVVKMENRADTFSYAAGKATTEGLLPYLEQAYHVDTAYMADFVRGFEDARNKAEDKQFLAYIAGTQIAKLVKNRIEPDVNRQFSEAGETLNLDLFYKGYADALLNNQSVLADSTARQLIEEQLVVLREAKMETYKKENKDWLEANKAKDGVQTLPSGLQYKVLEQGKGKIPTADQEVVVKYEGKLIDGTIFDSSYQRTPDTSSFRCNEVIKGWTEALTMMPVGSKWELYIPCELGYGERTAGKIKPYSTLVFIVELIGIHEEVEAL